MTPFCDVAAVLVTYFPGTDFEERLEELVPQVGKVIIVDNASGPLVEQLLSRLQGSGCHVIRNNVNYGVATALNQGIRWASGHGFKWVLTLDQDSRVHDGLVHLYVHALGHELAGQKIEVLNTRYIDINTGTPGVTFSGKSVNGWMDVEAVITSGSFFSMDTFYKAGCFRDDFLLDWADHDFCLRVRAAGLKNYIYPVPFLDHALGAKTEHRFFWGRVAVITNNHSSMRCYLISRNLVILLKEKFFREFHWSVMLSFYLLSKFILVLLCEKEKKKKILSLCRGILHGLFNVRTDPAILDTR